MDEIRNEKVYREEQCRKVFEHWHQNISIKCNITTSAKLPTWCLKDETTNNAQSIDKAETFPDKQDFLDEKMTDLQITKRVRDQDMFLEIESPFTQKFQLASEFNNKYEYFMQGKVDDIQIELQLMRDRLDKYMSKFPKRFTDDPPTTTSRQGRQS